MQDFFKHRGVRGHVRFIERGERDPTGTQSGVVAQNAVLISHRPPRGSVSSWRRRSLTAGRGRHKCQQENRSNAATGAGMNSGWASRPHPRISSHWVSIIQCLLFRDYGRRTAVRPNRTPARSPDIRHNVLLENLTYMSDPSNGHGNAQFVEDSLTNHSMLPGGPHWSSARLVLYKQWRSDGYLP